MWPYFAFSLTFLCNSAFPCKTSPKHASPPSSLLTTAIMAPLLASSLRQLDGLQKQAMKVFRSKKHNASSKPVKISSCEDCVEVTDQQDETTTAFEEFSFEGNAVEKEYQESRDNAGLRRRLHLRLHQSLKPVEMKLTAYWKKAGALPSKSSNANNDGAVMAQHPSSSDNSHPQTKQQRSSSTAISLAERAPRTVHEASVCTAECDETQTVDHYGGFSLAPSHEGGCGNEPDWNDERAGTEKWLFVWDVAV